MVGLTKRAAAPGVSRRSEAATGYLFIAIPLLLYLVLFIGAIGYALYVSVWEWNIRTGPVSFVGLDNYADALADPTFQTAIRNSLYYAVVWVPLTMVLGLSLALIVNQKLRGQTFFRAAYYFPRHRELGGEITMIWLFIVAPDGLFNQSAPRSA